MVSDSQLNGTNLSCKVSCDEMTHFRRACLLPFALELAICWRKLLSQSLCLSECWVSPFFSSLIDLIIICLVALFILKLLFNLQCAQTLDTFNDLHILNMPFIHLLVYDEVRDWRSQCLQLRHPLPPPFLILPKCTTMRDPSFLFDFYRFDFWVLICRCNFFQVWACCIFSSSYAGLCCA